VAVMKIRVTVIFLFAACFLATISVAGQNVPTSPPEGKTAVSAAESETAQKQKMLDAYEKALEKRDATLERSMDVLKTAISVFDTTIKIWTIFLAVLGLIVSFFGYKWWEWFNTLMGKFKTDVETTKALLAEAEKELEKGKKMSAEAEPLITNIKKKIEEVEKEAEAARQNIVGGVREMMAGREDKPSAEVKAKLDDFARKLEFLESFGAELKPEHYLSKGISFYWDKDYEKALLAFNRAIKGNEKLADAWHWKGLVLNNLKRYEDALVAFEQAITLNPKYDRAWNNKGRSLAGLKKTGSS